MAAFKPAFQLQQDGVQALLVENRQLVRAGLQRVLEDTGVVKVAASVANCDEAIRMARKAQVDIMIINMFGSAVGLLDGARKLRRQFPKIRLLILAPEHDLVIQDRLLQFGVSGCVSSHCSLEELMAAVDVVCRGGRYISDTLAQKLAGYRLPGGQKLPFDELTHRELQILLLVAEGKNTLSIARELCLTQKTINTYRNRLLDKLGIETEVGLVHLAIRHGLYRLPEYGEGKDD